MEVKDNKKVRLLPPNFRINNESWGIVESEPMKWNIYLVFNSVLHTEKYIVFKYKAIKDDTGGKRQVRPVPDYETDTTWYYECEVGEINKCYTWLLQNNLIERI